MTMASGENKEQGDGRGTYSGNKKGQLPVADGCSESPNCAGDLRCLVGRNILRWRNFSNCPLKYLASQMRVSISICSQWEHGRRFPSARHLANLASLFNCPASCLLCAEFMPQAAARQCVCKFAESKKMGVVRESKFLCNTLDP